MAKQHPSALDRLVQQAMGSDRQLGRDDDKAKLDYPLLWDWLTRVFIGRDLIKQPAVLTVRLGPEGALATLTDRDLGVSIDVAAPHLGDVLAAVEAALAGPCPPVKTWSKKQPKLRKRNSSS